MSKIVQKKICLLGEYAVGKTSLVRRFVTGRFDEKYLSTIGVKISRKRMQRAQQQLHVMLWDLAGGEDFFDLGATYLRGSAGAMIVCDLTRADTLPSVIKYANQLRTVSPLAQIVVVGNKVDLEQQRVIDDDSLQRISHELGAPHYVTSAKSGANVESAFSRLADLLDGITDELVTP